MSKPDRSQNQWILAGIFGVLALALLYGVSQVLNTSGSVAARPAESAVTTTMISERTSAASPEASWINSATDRLKRMEDQQKALQEALAETEARHKAEVASLTSQTDEILQQYEQKIVVLQRQVDQRSPGNPSAQRTPSSAAPGVAPTEIIQQASVPRRGLVQSPLGQRPGSSQDQQTPVSAPLGFAPSAPFAREFSLVARQDDSAPNRRKLGSYLPAGSYAPATVLSGVDAPTNVASQTDPIPVVFRITGPAVTAGVRKTSGQRIDLTGCTVTGSAKGDLSSERVLVRLLKMSCVLPNGDVFEDNVAGYMSGNGKTGVRGHVVSREGTLVTKAGIAGALGGLAQGVSSVGQAGADSEQASFEQVLSGAGASAASGGVGQAASLLSEYYIERAEQYQPIVSLYGGTNVELVFLEGVNLDG